MPPLLAPSAALIGCGGYDGPWEQAALVAWSRCARRWLIGELRIIGRWKVWGTGSLNVAKPHSDELLESNLRMFEMAKGIAGLLGRRVATADEYRQVLGLETRAHA